MGWPHAKRIVASGLEGGRGERQGAADSRPDESTPALAAAQGSSLSPLTKKGSISLYSAPILTPMPLADAQGTPLFPDCRPAAIALLRSRLGLGSTRGWRGCVDPGCAIGDTGVSDTEISDEAFYALSLPSHGYLHRRGIAGLRRRPHQDRERRSRIHLRAKRRRAHLQRRPVRPAARRRPALAGAPACQELDRHPQRRPVRPAVHAAHLTRRRLLVPQQRHERGLPLPQRLDLRQIG